MEKEKKDGKIEKDKSYFSSGNLVNMKSTDVNNLIKNLLVVFTEVLMNIIKMEVIGDLKILIDLKFIPLDITQLKGQLIFLFQIGYQIKRLLLIFKTKLRNAFFGVYLDIFILKKEMNID